MSKTRGINEELLALANEMYITLEGHILEVSSFNNTLNKFFTGFGWSQNLTELYRWEIINPSDEKGIKNVMECLANLQFKREITIHEWNTTVYECHRLENVLNFSIAPNSSQ